MKKTGTKNRGPVLIAAAALVLALALCWYFTGNKPGQVKTAGESPFQAAPMEQYAAQTEWEQYHRGYAEIKILIRNDGETMHEFNHPVLEWQRDGTWYSLKKEAEPTTENLLYIEPGETKTFSLWTESYGTLDPGHYRAVFPVWKSTDYVVAEFDIVS